MILQAVPASQLQLGLGLGGGVGDGGGDGGVVKWSIFVWWLPRLKTDLSTLVMKCK